MKKNNTVKQSLKKGTKKTTKDAKESITIGMDLGDKTSRYCILNGSGEVREEGSVPTSKKGMMQNVRRHATVPDRHGSGRALAVGELLAEQFGVRSDCGECTAGQPD